MTQAGTIALAKQKAPKRDPDSWKIQPIAAQVRGSAEWKAWLEELAMANRQTVAGLLDTAVVRLAKEIGFREPPEALIVLAILAATDGPAMADEAREREIYGKLFVRVSHFGGAATDQKDTSASL